MTLGFSELVVGDVLVAPFVPYAVSAAVIFMLLRPVLRLIGMERLFSNPPVAGLCVYVVILASLIAVF